MALETQYTANTGMATISTANSNLDGTGTLGTVLTAASNGTLIKSISIKAQGNTTAGMIRLYACGLSNRLISEVEVPAITKSSIDPAFEITLNGNWLLQSGGSLKASTEKAETFNVFGEGLNWAYYASVRPESTNFTANNGMATITTANTALDGSGTLGTNIWDVITAASNGTTLHSVVIKSIKTASATTPGMVRLFLYDGSNTKLLTEVPVPAITQLANANSFSHRIDFGNKGFALKSGWKLRATTEKTESFNVIAEGLDWAYPA